MAQGVQAMASKAELDPQTNTVGENSRKKPSDLHMHECPSPLPKQKW